MISKCRKELFQFHASHPLLVLISLALSPSSSLALKLCVCVYFLPPWRYRSTSVVDCIQHVSPIHPLVLHLNVISRERKSCRKEKKTFFLILNFFIQYTKKKSRRKLKIMFKSEKKSCHVRTYIHTQNEDRNWNRPQFYVFKIMALIYHNY